MATEQTKPTTDTTLDWKKAEEHLENVKNAALKNSGRDNHNPFLWIAEHVTTLHTLLGVATERTKELHSKIMNLPAVPDTRVDKTIPDGPKKVVAPK